MSPNQGVAMLARVAAIALVVGCSEEANPLAEDAGRVEFDAGDRRDVGAAERDASELESDAGDALDAARADGGRPRRDAGPGEDAGSSEVCDIYFQTGCAAGEACRLEDRGIAGAARCEPAGIYADGQPYELGRHCRGASGEDLCAAGLFCGIVCRRYCRPRLPPACPPSPPGYEQRCIEDERLPIPYCTDEFTP